MRKLVRCWESVNISYYDSMHNGSHYFKIKMPNLIPTVTASVYVQKSETGTICTPMFIIVIKLAEVESS